MSPAGPGGPGYRTASLCQGQCPFGYCIPAGQRLVWQDLYLFQGEEESPITDIVLLLALREANQAVGGITHTKTCATPVNLPVRMIGPSLQSGHISLVTDSTHLTSRLRHFNTVVSIVPWLSQPSLSERTSHLQKTLLSW